MAETPVCYPLTEEEYTQVFSTFIDASTEYPQIICLAKSLIDMFHGRAIDLMSVGAGTGCIENDLVKHHQLNLKSFVAIEPNADHLQILKQTVAKWRMINVELQSIYFDETYETSKKFDIILMSHSMYCVDSPVAAIVKAKSLLKPNGKIIIFCQTEEGGHELYARMMQEVRMERPINDHFVTCQSISEALHNNGIKHDVRMAPSHIDVTDFVERNPTPTCNDSITFLLQTDFSSLNEELKRTIYHMVKQRITTMKKGRHMFNHPTGMVVVYNTQKNFIS